MGRSCSTNEVEEVGKPGRKRLLGRPRRRWVDIITMDLGEAAWGDVDWIGLAQDMKS
jgi:hypothetical protein